MKTYRCQKCDEIGCILTLDSSQFDPTVCPFDAAKKVDWEKMDDKSDTYVGPGEIPGKAR